MTIALPVTIGTKNHELKKLEDDTREAFFRMYANNPILNGLYIENIAIVSGTAKVVNHKLQRKLKGYFIGKISADANIWDTASGDKTLTLNSDANVTVSIWVF